ncbi:hypothetical protein K0M31_005619 [Melipona bicolor]|uniref:Uncharacterized protein n=1 Tax=Melipona bicolor TaxID=60889 RepID=A0AA40FTT7_9HYME|nr:hypothetical protein K0M31_005619 [Melipona bicolor]
MEQATCPSEEIHSFRQKNKDYLDLCPARRDFWSPQNVPLESKTTTHRLQRSKKNSPRQVPDRDSNSTTLVHTRARVAFLGERRIGEHREHRGRDISPGSNRIPNRRRVNGPAAGIINSSGRQHTRARAHAEDPLRAPRWPGPTRGSSGDLAARREPAEKKYYAPRREREQRLYYLRGPSLCDSCRHTCANVPTIATIHLWPRGHAEYRTTHIGTEECPPGSGRPALRPTPRKTGANEGTNFFELSRDFDVNEPRSPFDVPVGLNRWHVPSARSCAPATRGNESRVG